MRKRMNNEFVHRLLAIVLTLALVCGVLGGAKPANAADEKTPVSASVQMDEAMDEISGVETEAAVEEPEETEDVAEEKNDEVSVSVQESEETEETSEEIVDTTEKSPVSASVQMDEAMDEISGEETEAAVEEPEETEDVAEEKNDEVSVSVQESEETEETSEEIVDTAEKSEESERVAVEEKAEEEAEETSEENFTSDAEKVTETLEVEESEEEETVEPLSETTTEEDYEREIPKTKVFTKAGPFLDPVHVGRRTLLKAARRGAAQPNGDSQTPSGLELAKHATPKEGGGYTLTLEAYTTGTVTSETVSVPVDIVLVLDQSGSMAYDFNGNSSSYANSRQKAMQDAVKNFISAVGEKYDVETSDHRISIVTFGSNSSILEGWTDVDEAGITTLTGDIDGLPHSPSGATNAGAGMGSAQQLLIGNQYSYEGPNTTRQKVCVMFTDGVPTTASDFSIGVASGAINAAKNIKDAGATVYSIGIFNGADPSELYGARGFDTNSNGTVGSRWSMDVWGLFPGNDFPEADRPAGNRFLNYLSSNFPDATEIGLTRRESGWGILHKGVTYQITRNFTRKANNYYLTADDSASLNNIFQSISEQISTPTISLGTETVVQDIVSPQFRVPEGGSVKFYTQAYNGNDSWGSKQEITNGSVRLVEGTSDDNVSVTGYDFDANCVTEEAKEDGSHGKKLIIEIDVEPDPYFLGGTVSTNGDDSGVIDKDGNPIAYFDNPVVSEPAKQLDPNIQNNDVSIYLTQSADPADLISIATMQLNGENVPITTLFNGINNAGVMFEVILDNGTTQTTLQIPAEAVVSIVDGKIVVSDKNGNPVGGWDITELPEGVYTVTTRVTDIGNLENATETEHDVTSKVHVFKPQLSLADKHVYYMGDAVTVTAEEDWICEDSGAPDPAGAPPTLEYTIVGMTGEKVDFTEDLEVTLREGKVMIGETDVTADTAFVRSCSTESLTDTEKAPAGDGVLAKIHVYLPSIAFQDMSAFYGEKITLPDVSTSTTWVDSEANEAPSAMDNTKPEFAAELSAEGKVDGEGYVIVKEDFGVKAVVTLGGEDITEALIQAGRITRTCDADASHTEVTKDQAFVVHVKTLKLEVKKLIEGLFADKTAKYDFTVKLTHPSEEIADQNLTASLGDKESKEFAELPLNASFTVTETNVKEGYTVTFTSEGASVSANGAVGTGTLTENTKITVTNKLENIPATGLSVRSVGVSIVGMMMLFAGIVFLHLKRKRSYYG